MRLSDSLSFSVYMNIYIKDMFEPFLEKCPRRVNSFRTKYVFVIICDLGGLFDPPFPGVNVKVPFQGKQYVVLVFVFRDVL